MYLKRMAESKNSGSTSERMQADRVLKQAARALQQAQMTQRLNVARRAGISRPGDWNVEVW
jgi:hypothetical protein